MAEYDIYIADIERPRSMALMVYQDTYCWITLADSEGVKTTILVNLNDEGDRKFAEQFGLVAGVLAIMMSPDESE